MANPGPEGFGTVTPHRVVREADEAIDYYRAAFGATELMRLSGRDGSVVRSANRTRPR